MRCSLDHLGLAHALTESSHIVSTRTTLPILAHLLIQAEESDTTESEGTLTLASTNLESSLRLKLAAVVDEGGRTTAPAKLLTELVKSLPAAHTIELTHDGAAHLTVRSGKSRTNMRTMDAAEYPTIPEVPSSAHPVGLAAPTLLRQVERVAFAAAKDDSRPVFTGVYARFDEDCLTLAAADSFRLAVSTHRWGSVPADLVGKSVLIPAHGLVEGTKILAAHHRVLDDATDATGGQLRIALSENGNLLTLASEDVTWSTALIAGMYPNFEAILPKGAMTRLVVPLSALKAAARTVGIVSAQGGNIMALERGAESSVLRLSAEAEDTGASAAEVDLQDATGAALTMYVNGRYISEVLAALDGQAEAVELCANGDKAPLVIRPLEDDRYTYVMMPMYAVR